MVAIFTGAGTGIERSSARTLGGSGLLGSATLGRSGEQAYVNAATGNLMLTAVDEMLLGRGPDAVISRTYNSFGGWDGDNDDNWRASGYRRVFGLAGGTGYGTVGSTVKRTDWDGSEVTYSWNAASSAYVATDGAGAYDTLTRTGTNWTWVDGDTQIQEVYDDSNSGRITSQSDTSGNNSVSYGYTGTLLTQITTADGGYTLLKYGGTGGLQLQSLETHSTSPTATTTRVFYSYDANDRLSKVQVNLNPADNSATVTSGVPTTYNYETTYTYDDANGISQRVASISQNGGALVEFKYDTGFRVSEIKETIASGATPVTRTTTIAYDTVARITTVTDALGQATQLSYDASGNLLSLTLPPSGTSDPAPSASFTYEADGDLATMKSAGNTVVYSYDSRGNRTLERDSLGNTVTRTFSAKNELLSETHYTVPDPDGVGSTPPSGAMTTRYAYDAKSNLRFVVDGEGRVTEYVYNLYNQRTAVIGYAANLYTGTPDLETWAAGIADKSTTQRTETIYDFRGNISEVISYARVTTTGAFDTTSERNRTLYVYNGHGELLSRYADGTGVTETFVYDGLGRVISSAETVTPPNLHVGADNPGYWTTANTDIDQVTGTAAGTALSLTAKSQNLAIASSSTHQTSVAEGDTLTFTVQLIGGTFTTASFGLLGGSSLFGDTISDSSAVIVSGQGTLTRVGNGSLFQVSGLATDAVTTVSITRKFTRVGGESVTSRVYVGSASAGTALGNSIIFSKATLTRTPAAASTITTNFAFTDGSGNSATKVTLANGLVRTSTYDRTGNLLSYAESGTGIASPSTTSYKYDALGRLRMVTDPTGQRDFFFYDADGRKIAAVDSDGSVTEFRYNAAGRVTTTIAYATKLAPQLLVPGQPGSLIDSSGNPASLTFASIRPATDTANDRWGWNYYDTSQQLIRTIDATGAVTVFEYDGASQLVTTAELATRMTVGELTALKTGAPPTNIFPNPNAASQWGTANGATINLDGLIGGANAYRLKASSSGLAFVPATTSVPVRAGDTLTFTLDLLAGSSTSITASIGLRGSTSDWGAAVNSTAVVISGTATITQTVGGLFISGLDPNAVTRISITRTFLRTETASAIVYVGSGASGSAPNNSILFGNPVLIRPTGTPPALPALDAVNDRASRLFYDNAGRLIGSLDAEGYVSKVIYDKAGRKIETIARKTKPSTTTGSFATIFASAAVDDASDIHNWWVYDSRGLMRATVDGEGTLTRLDYGPGGYLAKQESGQKLNVATLIATAPTFAGLPAAAGGEVLATTSWTRNAHGQALSEVTALTGSITTTTSYTYDNVYNLLSSVTQSGGTDPRTYNKRYDTQGRLISELSGIGSAVLAALGGSASQTDINNTYLDYGWSYAYDAAGRLISKIAPRGPGMPVGTIGPKTLYYYNADGALIYEIDPLGQTIEYRYNAFGESTDTIVYATPIANLSNMDGGLDISLVTARLIADSARDTAVHRDFNVGGTLKQSRDALSNVSTYEYNAFGELFSSTVPLDGAATILSTRAYDRRGLLKTQIVDAAAAGKAITTQYGYDAFGRAVELTNANNKKTTSEYDRDGRLVKVTDALNNSTSYTYDARDNLVAVTDANNKVTRYVYDKAGRRIATIDALGGLSTTTYDADGRVIASRDYLNAISLTGLATEVTEGNAALTAALANTNAADRITRYAYDKDGQLRFGIDALNHVVEHVYDARGNAIRTIAYDGTIGTDGTGQYSATWIATQVASLASAPGTRVSRAVYDILGQQIYSIDALGQVSARTYDAKGQLTKQVQYSVAYTAPGNPSLADMTAWRATAPVVAGAANDRTTRAYYDNKGQLNYSVDALGNVTRTEYDKLGNVKRTTAYAAAAATTITDATTLANLNADTYLSSSPADRHVTEFKYDSAGRLEETLFYLRFSPSVITISTKLVRDAMGQILSSTDAFGTADASTTAYEYDAVGNVTQQTRGQGTAEVVITTYAYDKLGQLTDRTIAATTADAATTHWEYDALGRSIKEQRGYATPQQVDTLFEYNGLGDLWKVTDPRGNATYRWYDNLGRATYVRDAENYLTQTSYNNFGETASVTRRFNQVSGTAVITTPPVVTATVPNPLVSYILTDSARDATTSFVYDKLGRLSDQTDAEAYHTTYSYTRGGQISTVTRGGATTRLDYDKLDRLKKSTDALGFYESYGYDAFGNRTSVTAKSETGVIAAGATTIYTYDNRGLLLTETLPTPTYDSAGTQTSTTVVNRYEYDARGNRTKMVEADNLSYKRTTSYTYDKLDRLSTKSGDAVPIDPAGTLQTPIEYYFYDRRDNLIESRDAAGARTLFRFDQLDRKTGEINALGTLSTFGYDPGGNLTTSRVFGTQVALPATPTAAWPADPSGEVRLTNYEYDRLGRRTATQMTGITTGSWNGSSYVTTPGDTLRSTVTYDARGNVVKTTDASGGEIFSYYDRLNRKTASVDQEGYLTGWVLDAEGNATSETRYAGRPAAPAIGTPPTVTTTLATDPANRITNFTYDLNGQRKTEARSNVVAYTLDANGVLSSATTTATIRYDYNGLGQVTRKTEATGDAFTYSYDGAGRLISEARTPYNDFTSTAGTPVSVTPTLRYSYNGLGDLTRTQQGGATIDNTNDHITRYAYGAGGRLTSMTDANNQARSYFYDIVGRKTGESYARANSSATAMPEGIAYQYDLLGRLTQQSMNTVSGTTWTQVGDRTQIAYNSYGEVSQRGINGYQEQFAYDLAGRVWRTNSGDGVWRFAIYDKNGNQTLSIESEGTDLAGKTLDQVVAIATNGGGNAIGAAYVDGINATITRYERRNLATDTIQAKRQLSSSVTTDLKTSRDYSAFGEVIWERDPSQAAYASSETRTNYTYNTMGRLISTERPQVSFTNAQGGTATTRPIDEYFYDLSGRLIGTEDANDNRTTRSLLAGTGYGGAEALVTREWHPGGNIQHGYDVFGDLRKTTDEIGRETTMQYDKLGRLTQVTHPGGLTDNYTYDLLGQRISHWNSFLGSSVVEKTDYDIQGRVISSVAFGGDTTTITYAFDANLATSGLGTFGGWTKQTTGHGRTLTEVTDLFGRTIDKIDLGNHNYDFTYDKAGRLISRTNNVGENLSYSYFNTGFVSSLESGVIDRVNQYGQADVFTYGYDTNGRKNYERFVHEAYNSDPESGSYLTTDQHQLATTTYDALGRMIHYEDVGDQGTTNGNPISVDYKYDKVGNIRKVAANYRDVKSGSMLPQTYWYAYDEMNRMTISMGILIGAEGSGTIDRGTYGGISINYDATGRRTDITRAITVQVEIPGDETTFTYSAPGVRREEYKYTTAGDLESVYADETTYDYNNVRYDPVPNELIKRSDYTRDAMGRVTNYKEYFSDGITVNYSAATTYGTGLTTMLVVSQTEQQYQPGTGGFQTRVTTTDYQLDTTGSAWNGITHGTFNGTFVGVQTHTRTVVDNNTSTASETETHYVWWDAALESHIGTFRSPTDTLPPVSDFTRDSSGHLVHLTRNSGSSATQVDFTTDAEGRVLARREYNTDRSQMSTEYHYLFDGAVRGATGNNGQPIAGDYIEALNQRGTTPGAPFRNGGQVSYANFDQNYEPMLPQGAGSGGSYVVREGDTLQSIAAQIWGDANLWYKLAEVNGLGAGSLTAGMTLRIPDGIFSVHNSASTFKVYDPNEAVGMVGPVAPQPKGGNKCGLLGQILLVAIAVAIVAITKAPVSNFFAGLFSGATGSAGAIATAGAGLAAGSAASIAGGVVGGAIVGAAASAVSQGFGLLTGIQQGGFSWKGVGLSAIGGAIGGGGSGGGFLNNALNGMISNAVTQGIALATKLQSKFDFAGLAAAGVGAGFGGEFSGKLDGLGEFGARVVSSTVGGLSNAAARSLINGTNFGDNLIAALPDIIGNTIGSLVAGGIAGGGRKGPINLLDEVKDGSYSPQAIHAAELSDRYGVAFNADEDGNYYTSASPADLASAITQTNPNINTGTEKITFAGAYQYNQETDDPAGRVINYFLDNPMYGGDWESAPKATTFDVLWAGNADLGAVRFISGGSNGRTYLYDGGATRYSDLGLSAVFAAPIAAQTDPNFVAYAQVHNQMVGDIVQARVDKALAQVDFEAGIAMNIMMLPTMFMGGSGASYAIREGGYLTTGAIARGAVVTRVGQFLRPAESGVWKLNPFTRGQQIEQALGHNLPGNFPVIDKFENGLATSIKSLDLDAATYQSGSTLTRTLNGYVDKVAGFQGRTWAGVRIRPQDVTGRALDLAIPHSGSAAQQAIISQTVKYGASRGVAVNVIHFP
ncbi:LysM peptidoglycan-binding domain-containing protein [Sphingomonas sp.]|uniref:endonuclease toxin domain-containing protein n=1 Tax=Sphingomonas sp. TaxID=28214 RepID=UPI003D6DA588